MKQIGHHQQPRFHVGGAGAHRGARPGGLGGRPLVEIVERLVAAIKEGREPNSSIQSVFDCYRVLGELEEQLAR